LKNTSDSANKNSSIAGRSEGTSNRSEWMSAAYFLLGVLVGMASILVLNTLTARPALDTATIQQASRTGALEALATLQVASQGAPVDKIAAGSTPTPATIVSEAAFQLREANRRGDRTAPVTIVEFSDFQCPFCERAFKQVLPQLKLDYIDTGRVSLVYKHSAFLGPESTWAAVAAECAADQGQFWAYHDLLFNRQAGENQGAFTKDKLLGFAKELELDLTKFEPCLTAEQTLARVQADVAEARQAGVTGTPTFFVNGQKLVGAQPYEQFRAVLEPLLAAPR
jgi:protein-disulfide isomerase